MKEEKTTPLRERMIEDMRIRGMSRPAQSGHRGYGSVLHRSFPEADIDKWCLSASCSYAVSSDRASIRWSRSFTDLPSLRTVCDNYGHAETSGREIRELLRTKPEQES